MGEVPVRADRKATRQKDCKFSGYYKSREREHDLVKGRLGGTHLEEKGTGQFWMSRRRKISASTAISQETSVQASSFSLRPISFFRDAARRVHRS